jgi:hypothetical protein
LQGNVYEVTEGPETVSEDEQFKEVFEGGAVDEAWGLRYVVGIFEDDGLVGIERWHNG